MGKFETTYMEVVVSIVRALFLFVGAIGVLIAFAAAMDSALGLQWGLGWRSVLGGMAFAILGYGGNLFTKMVDQIYRRIRG